MLIRLTSKLVHSRPDLDVLIGGILEDLVLQTDKVSMYWGLSGDVARGVQCMQPYRDVGGRFANDLVCR